MVSFFGLKIGGEKKKKSSKDLEASAPKLRNLDDPNAIDSNFFDFKGGPNPTYEASVYSVSRPESRQSSRSIKSKFKALKVAPFASNKFGSSMVDLPTPPSLRHHASNPSLGRRLNTGSSTSLSLAPPSFNPMARPSTSDGRSKTWVNPLDVHFTRDSAKAGFKGPLSPASTMRDDGQPSTPLSAAPRSPLGQYELKLDLPEDVSSFADFGNFGETVDAPAPLRIKKSTSTRLTVKQQTESQSSQKPPSPPLSIVNRETSENSTSRPLQPPATQAQPPSRSIPSDLEKLRIPTSNFGPTSLPSPSTTPRASEEKPPTTASSPKPASPPTKRGNAKPVIQNVLAKRDTLTINAQRRNSLQMKIEATESGAISSLSLADRSKTSNSGRSFERPPPLTLNMGFRLNAADRNGPQSAPFLPNPRTLTPVSVRSPLRSQVEIQGGSSRPALVNETWEQRSIDSPGGSSVYDEDHAYDYPPSPETTSPVIPLTGPLASPRFPPPSQSFGSNSEAFTFPREEIDTDRSPSPTTPPIPPRSLKRNPLTPDSSYWPVPSPVVPSFDRAAMSPSPADSRVYSESGSEPLSIYEPLELPHISASRSGAESPTFRSFNRPWTSAGTASHLKRTETTGPMSGLRMGGEFGGGLRPPPRSNPQPVVEGFKAPSARVGGNGMGNDFI